MVNIRTGKMLNREKISMKYNCGGLVSTAFYIFANNLKLHKQERELWILYLPHKNN